MFRSILSLSFAAALATCSQAPRPARDAAAFRSNALALGGLACPTASGRDFSGQDLTNANFSNEPPGSLRGANFKGAKLEGATFARQDLTGASFEGADLSSSERGGVDFTSAILARTCFIHASLTQADFSYAKLDCTDFSDTTLTNAVFGPTPDIAANGACRTKFVASDVDVRAIPTQLWGRVDFTNAKFEKLHDSTFTLRGKDITNAILTGVQLARVDFTGANLTGVDFGSANLYLANLAETRLNGARFDRGADLRYANLTCAQFATTSPAALQCNRSGAPPCPEAPAANVQTGAASLRQAQMQHATLDWAVLDGADLGGANLAAASARFATFRGATLEGGADFGAAVVQGADFTAANFQNAHLDHVLFTSVLLPRACFDQKTTLDSTDFTGSILPAATFDGAVLQDVKFNGAILEGSQFTGATLTRSKQAGVGVTFTCAQLGGSSFKDAKLLSASFLAAVMPPADACCKQRDGSAWCGTVDSVQETYGGVTYPSLTNPVLCPNGDTAECTATQWTLKDWQTDLCDPSHRMRQVWFKPDCASTPGDEVHFNDPNLKACILASLPGSPSKITVNTAAHIKGVSCPNSGISNLTGLDKLTGLESLDLSGNQLTTFTSVFGQLAKLNLESNQLSSLDVTGSPHLVLLNVSRNQLASLGLETLNPEILDVSYNRLTTVDLPILDALVFADLSHNDLTSVLDQYDTDLSRLTALSFLDLTENAIATIGGAQTLANPDRAVTLKLGCNPSFNCSSLELESGVNAPRVLRESGCAEFNAQSDAWILRTHPACSTLSATTPAIPDRRP